MNDKDFYEECIKREASIAFSRFQTQTNKHMTSIVLRNTPINYSDMHPDKFIDELFGNLNNSNISGSAYKFIRDNQDLYINPKCLNYTQVDKILNDINIQNILKYQKFSIENSKLILNEAICRAKFNVIEHFMEKGIIPSTDTAFFIEVLVDNSEDLEILKYLESKGVDLLTLGSGRLIKTATLKNNYDTLSYIIDKAPNNMHIIKQSLNSYIVQEFDSILSTKRREEQFFEITQKMTPIVNKLLSKLSSSTLEMTKINLKYDAMKDFLDKQYLSVTLQNELSTNNVSNNRMKI